ncbi:MAG TPA: type IX secretion system outer membrane channel protein PorV, partial [Bacteroidia bacterium]|nr:type IX secretion system outer membrane channel protein PorV [Bacteroidia bacterium]
YNASNVGVNTVTTAVPFLLITPDSRGGGMGDCGVASSPDANSMHWNPAKYVMADKDFGLSMSYTPWLRQLVPDISLSYLAGYKKIGKLAAVAGSLRYFTLGSIQFTDINGNAIGTYKPAEIALDAGYSQKLGANFSAGMAMRYIYSNLTNSIPLPNGTSTHPGTSFAVDIAMYYLNKKIKLQEKKAEVGAGLNISNVGAKISYTDNATPQSKDFIPIQMRLGGSLKIHLDDYNSITFLTDLTKLLVPTPPIYARDPVTGLKIPDGNGGYEIAAGKDPYRGITAGILGSFNDAPGGAKEELKEINEAVGMEYWYDNLIAFRMGYFHEDKTKGNRQYMTFGLGVKYSVFAIDMAYLVPLSQRNPLQNTLRFSLSFDFAAMKKGDPGSSATTPN